MKAGIRMTEVNSFWHGPELSNLERLCISSFLKEGIRYCLYVYEPPANLPDGVVLKDANEILERSRLFYYQAGPFNRGSVGGFSNLFRFTLLAERGGWWTDTDVCYLGKLPEDTAEVYFAEGSPDGAFVVGTALFKSEPGSAVLRYCLDRFAEKDVARIVHAETGPVLLTAAIVACAQEKAVRKGSLAFPVPWWEYKRLFFDEELSLDGAGAVHFWNAMLASENVDKNGDFPRGSVFERLKQTILETALLDRK